MAVCTPVEEVEFLLVVKKEKEEKGEGVFCREGRVVGPTQTMLSVDLGEEVVLRDGELVVGEGDTLGEVVEIMNMTPVEEGEDLTTMEQIRKMNVVFLQLDMVR